MPKGRVPDRQVIAGIIKRVQFRRIIFAGNNDEKCF